MNHEILIVSPAMRMARGILFILFMFGICVVSIFRAHGTHLLNFGATLALGILTGLTILLPEIASENLVSSVFKSFCEVTIGGILCGIVLELLMANMGYGFSFVGPIAFTLGTITVFATAATIRAIRTQLTRADN